MEYKDYYRTLGVGRDASEKEIKSSFRKLARQHHPDVNPDDPQAEERFKEVNEAYEVLSDPEKRGRYDQMGADWQRWQRSGGGQGDYNWGQWASGQPGTQTRYATAEDLQDLFGGSGAFSDFFSQIFGGARANPGGNGFQYQAQPQRGPMRGHDYEQALEISLQEAYGGTTRVLQKEGKRLEVKIPAGAKTGTKIRMTGEGSPGANGGPTGNLYLKVNVQPDPRFERRGDDLHTQVTVDLYTLLLGGEVRVPSMTGHVGLRVPEGTKNGRTFRLRGKGMPRLRQPDEHGDLYAKVRVQLPTELDDRQRALFEELQQIGAEAA